METTFIYIGAAVLVCMGWYHLFLSRKAIIHSKIKLQAAKKIGEVKEGEVVRITGRVVHAGRTLVAPLSGRACVYYNLRVKDSSRTNETFKNYIDIEESRAADVVVFDGNHYAVIDTKLLAAYVEEDEEQYSGMWISTSEELKAFLKKKGERTEDYLGWSLDLCAYEAVIEEGETLNIVGKCGWRKSSDFKLKLPFEAVLYVQALNEHGVYLTDDKDV